MPRDIVVVGGSAGALQPLTEMLHARSRPTSRRPCSSCCTRHRRRPECCRFCWRGRCGRLDIDPSAKTSVEPPKKPWRNITQRTPRPHARAALRPQRRLHVRDARCGRMRPPRRPLLRSPRPSRLLPRRRDHDRRRRRVGGRPRGLLAAPGALPAAPARARPRAASGAPARERAAGAARRRAPSCRSCRSPRACGWSPTTST